MLIILFGIAPPNWTLSDRDVLSFFAILVLSQNNINEHVRLNLLKKEILNIDSREETYNKISDRIKVLNKVFQALNMDYSYHIETTFGKEHKVFDLKKDIDYRLFSSKLHLQLLFRQHLIIEDRIERILIEEPRKITASVFPSNPIFDHCEQEASAILDSIIFHLASVYDYISSIINFIINNKSENISKWSQLNNSCLDKNNAFYNKEIAKIITSQHNLFVNKLYSHRSRLIHKTSEIHPISLELELQSEKAKVMFFANHGLTKNFKELKELAKTKNITLEYTAQWLIENTVTSIFTLMYSLKDEIYKISTFPERIEKDEIVMMYRDPKTGEGHSPAIVIWEQIKADINSN